MPEAFQSNYKNSRVSFYLPLLEDQCKETVLKFATVSDHIKHLIIAVSNLFGWKIKIYKQNKNYKILSLSLK